jgi:putative ABC transport system ATP-binding protein
MHYLEVRDIHKRFVTPGGSEVNALQGVSFSIERGEILCVVGHNGSGKTTLLNCIRNAFPWDAGDILVEGRHCTSQFINVVSVFQDVGLGVVGSMTSLENLSLVFSKQRRFMWSFPKRRFERRVRSFLEITGLLKQFESLNETPVSELSGGQRQQVAILMAVMREPDILLLDEFVANLDFRVKEDILTWVREWIRSQKVTTLMVTHDISLAENWGDWILELSDGKPIRFERTRMTKEEHRD